MNSTDDKPHGKIKKIIKCFSIGIAVVLLVIVIGAVALFCLGGWKIPILRKIENLKLPDGCTTVYRTKIQISDVYWLHIAGEKVIKCDLGYEETKQYMEANNSESALENISIYPYGGMSDIAIYDSELDEEFWKQPDRDCYIKICYFKKL